ncbi:hypothetical protein [Gordonia sp. ABSL49_1]|uniref:hypothetical protein n=1 Tax=Gordonia sp. ABSL49_1 TaxID=2920941 RepID=UPI001F0FC54C|nr:hypothetical protein [Gordonia sp. ABSL49_1]MCH5645719.1 hypothetical protein [Gordonia sp. ABSL49_1]
MTTDNGHVCGVCRGPVRSYAGSVWKWTCRACIHEQVLANAEPPQPDPLPLLSGLRSHNSIANGVRLDADDSD